MGFYGKIEHTDKLNFVIDKIYPNRKTMEEEMDKDGVFIGRYVLIEYEQNEINPYVKLYKSPDSMDFYFDPSFNVETRAKYTENKNEETNNYYIELNEIVYIVKEDGTKQFYKCTGKAENSIYATFTETYNPEISGTYHVNYNIDIEKYGESRGYDSTVWQKIYIDEKEKYVMIAELNSVVPTFDITVDAPTLNPIPPHFDADSNNVYYKLHMQPSWGFKVKEATENMPSDTTVTATLAEWDDINKTINSTITSYDGAIYFNRDGFSSDYHYNKNDNAISLTDNKIQLTTEASGRKYNTAHGTTEHHDIQALEIILPGIGKAISDLWDLVYGTGDSIDGDNDKKIRNKEINWDTVTGLRLVKTSRNPDISGFEYDTQSVDTIAGCINSVHDLIGMIIVNDKGKKIEIDEALVNRIYYRDGQYWIKDLTYEYTEVSNENQPIENMKQFGDNYYYKNGNNYYKELEGYQAGNQYYEFGPNVVSGVKLCQEVWKPDTYYYKEGENYKLDASTYPDETKQYYKISQDLKNIPGVDSKKGEKGLCFFPTAYNETTYNNLFPTTKATTTTPGKGLFYIGEDANGQTGYLPFEQGKGIQFQTPLHYWENYEIEISTTTEGKFIETYEFSRATRTPVEVIPFSENTFYYLDNITKEWTLLESEADIDISKVYYQFGENGVEKEVIDGLFYEPNLYYYLDYVDYIMDTDEEREPNIDYYTIDKNAIEIVSENTVFYEPNKYYYKVGEKYILDTAKEMTPNRVYYRDIYTRYVGPESTNKNFNIGQVWNEEVKDIPADVKLTNRKESYEWKQLNGFARTLNTINGLILKINNIMKFDDTLTRDNKTVQGCINMINDIINTIDTLKPNHIIAVNEFGHMTSMAAETDNWIDIKINNKNDDKIIVTHEFHPRENSTSNSNINTANNNNINIYTPYVDEKGHVIGHNEETVTLPYGFKFVTTGENEVATAKNVIDTLTINTDEWLTATADSNNNILFNHEYPKVINNTTSSIDLNNNTDTIVLETLEKDEKGHVIKINQETVTLPYGYKTFTSTGISSISNSDIYGETNGKKPAVNKTQTIADNTQDILEINPANKWIQTKIENDKLTIAHEIHSIDKTNKNTTNLNNPLVDSITVQDLEFDDAGHNTKNQKHTYTLPFGYKTLQDSNESVGKTIATNTQDTLTLKGDSWIKPTISQGQIVYTHIGPVVGEYDSKNNVTPKFGDTFTIEDWYFDSKGHKHSKNSHTVMIPKGSLADATASGSDLITQLSFTPESGALSTSRVNLSSLKLAGYVKETSNSNISAEDTLAQALSKLQTQIIEEKNARTENIADLDMAENASTTQFISSIKQENGKVVVERAAAGTLNLGDTYSIANESSMISSADSINSAFGKLEYKLNILNGANTVEGSVANQIAKIVNENNNGSIDSLNEIAAWIINDSTGAANMSNRISSLEGLVGKSSVNTQITEAIEAENLEQYALDSTLKDLEDRVEVIEEKDESWDEGLERIAFLEALIDTNKVAAWDKAEENVQADWAEEDETADAFIKNKPDLSDIVRTADLDDVVKTTTTFDYIYNETTTEMTISQLLEKIADLEARIVALENPVSPEPEDPTPEPEPEIPEEEPTE